jgi:hypothetical protein
MRMCDLFTCSFESFAVLNLSLVTCAGSPVKHCYRLSCMGGRQRFSLDWWGGLQNWWSKCSYSHNQGKDGMCPWFLLHLCYFLTLHSSMDIFASELNPAILSWITGYECIFNLGLLYVRRPSHFTVSLSKNCLMQLGSGKDSLWNYAHTH